MSKLALNRDNVMLQVEAKTWEEAIKIGGQILVKQGFATNEYVEGIIEAIKDLGPYVVISDNIAIPHTRPEQGALKVGCSLITLKEPVYFEGNDAVKVMICFSAVDNESHMDILKMIVEFIEHGLIDDIASAKTYEDLLEVISSEETN